MFYFLFFKRIKNALELYEPESIFKTQNLISHSFGEINFYKFVKRVLKLLAVIQIKEIAKLCYGITTAENGCDNLTQCVGTTE